MNNAKIYFGEAFITSSISLVVKSKPQIRNANLKNIRKMIRPVNQDINFRERFNTPLDSG